MPFHLVHRFEGDYDDGSGVPRHVRTRVGYSDGAIHHTSSAEIAVMIVQHVDAMVTAVTTSPPQVNQWGNNSWRVYVNMPPPHNALWFEFQVLNDGPPYYFRVEVYHIEFAQQKYKVEAKNSLYLRALEVMKGSGDKKGGGGKGGGTVY